MRVIATLSILASSLLFAQSASAVENPYSVSTGSGNVACLTVPGPNGPGGQESGYFTIEDNVVTRNTNCYGRVVIPEGVHTIGYMSLASNNITSVVMPNSLTHIRDEAFIRSNSIQSVTFGNNVSYIGDGAFADMTAMTSLTLPDSLRQIGSGAFARMNPAITSITIPNGVTGINAWAFQSVNFTSYRYCGNSLSNWALYRSELDKIPNTCLTGIGSLYSSSIGSGDVACTTGFFTILNNVVTGSKECSGAVNVPSGVTSIAEGSFGGRPLTSVTIPNSVLSIGGVAFGASSLTTLSIGNGLTTIDRDAFLWTNSLSSFSYCGTLLNEQNFEWAGLSGKTKTCVPSLATVTSGSVQNSQMATFSNGVTEAEIPATTDLPAVKLTFTGSAPTAVTVKPLTSNPASLTATPFKITRSTKIVEIQVTSGSFTGSATVCLDGAETDSVFHYVGNEWVALANRTYANGQVCGDTTSFSPFTAAAANSNPNAPGSVVATATSKRSATVSFIAPVSDGGSAITSYTAISTPGSITKKLEQSGSGTFTFDNLQPATSYTFTVTAKNAIGTSSAATSNSIRTDALVPAALSAITFTDDGTGTAGKLTWSGKNIDAVLYTGPANSYPGPFSFGAFTGGWNGVIRNLTPDTQYTVSIFAISADGIGESKSLTFKTGSGVLTDAPKATAQVSSQLNQIISWVNQNSFVPGEAANISSLLTKFDALVTSAHRSYIKVPTSRVSKVEVKSLTPKACSVVSATAKVDAGLVTALTKDTCTISYTVSGASRAWATFVKDFTFQKVSK